jgi:TonB-linked SusC/RagA family outer membrane protein
MEKIMKYIRIGVFILGLSLCFTFGASAQSDNILDSDTSAVDSLVHVVYKTINKNDLPNAISVLKPGDNLDKFYRTYPLSNDNAFIGGSNLWNIGTPLVLIDGVSRSTDDVITSEVDQITYLKGANAVVLYGSRAANGVILITTKHGHIGQRKSNINVNAGICVPKSYPKYLGSAEYMTYYNQARANDGMDALYDSTISNYGSHKNTYRYPDVDYYSSEYLRKMYNSYDVNADFSGGNERAQFYAIAGLQKQNSLLNFGEGKNENITRLNVRGNIDLKLNDHIKTYISLSNVFYDSRQANGNYWDQASTIQPHRFSPLVPIDLIQNSKESENQINSSRHIIDGKYLLGGNQEYLTNPISDVYAAGYNTYTSRQFQYTNGIDVDLGNVLKGLSLHGQMAIDYSNLYKESIDNTYAVYVPIWTDTLGTDSISKLTKYNKDSNTGTQNLSDNWNSQLIDFNVHLDYQNTFSEKHNVSAMILAAGLRSRHTGDYQYRNDANLGLQLGYNFDHKYYADFSGAIVNSTKLASKERVAFSPTLSLGWVLSEEDFLKNSSVVDRLKVSASAGIINTDLDIDTCYLYNAKYSSTAYFSWADGTFVNQATTISRDENMGLTYSKRKEVNFGLEGSLFNELLDFRTNVFLIKKDGIPVQRFTIYPTYFHTSWPETAFVPFTNYEANSYKGFDFQLDFNKKVGEVNMTIGVAGTYVTTEALVRDELYVDSYRNRAGKPTDAIFGLENEGFFISETDITNSPVQRFGEVKPGDIKYKDQNNDGVIDERDEVMIGRWGNPFTCGLHFTAQWKDLTLFVSGTGYFGGTAIKDDAYYWVYGDRKYSTAVRDSWTEETKNTATYPRLTTLSGDNNFRSSDFWTYSTNQINISSVQLTYSLPDRIFKSSPIKGLNVYVNGANLLMISKNRDIMELNVGTNPQIRFYNLGVKAKF